MKIPRKKSVNISFVDHEDPKNTVHISFTTISQGELLELSEKVNELEAIVNDETQDVQTRFKAGKDNITLLVTLLRNKCLDEEAKEYFTIDNVSYEEARALIDKLKATFTLGQ